MIQTFRNKALADLWEKGRTATPDEMNLPGFDFHPLKGFKPTRYSVHVNGPWCITFEFTEGDAVRVDFEQYH
jgi:proteic killer suppression protein